MEANQPKLESKKFWDERIKREKSNTLWKNHGELVDKNKLYYTEQEKELIKELLYNPIPPEFRSEYWYIVTGAKLECKNNPGYYNKLKSLIPKFQDLEFPVFKTIENDVNRLVTEEKLTNGENEKLYNILKSFAIRNSPSIGYIQGFDHIAAHLLNVLIEEEKVFWCFTKIIEDYLPFNYFLQSIGANIDKLVIKSFLKDKMKFFDQLQDLYMWLDGIIYNCIGTLYTKDINKNTSYIIWDIFLFYGEITLFRAFYFYGSVSIDKNFVNYNEDDAAKKLENNLLKIIPNDLLNQYLLLDKTIKESEIKIRRNEAKKDKFLVEQIKVAVNNNKNAVITNKCDIKIPYCFYNKDIYNIDLYSEYKIFKGKENTKKEEDYFTNLFEGDKFNDNNGKVIKNENLDDGNIDDLLVERVNHVCKEENRIVQK